MKTLLGILSILSLTLAHPAAANPAIRKVMDQARSRQGHSPVSMRWLESWESAISCEHYWGILQDQSYWKQLTFEAQGELREINQSSDDPFFIRRIDLSRTLSSIAHTHRAMVAPFFDFPIGQAEFKWLIQKPQNWSASMKWIEMNGFVQIAANGDLIHDYFGKSEWSQDNSMLTLRLPISIADICSPVGMTIGYYPDCQPGDFKDIDQCWDQAYELLWADLTELDKSNPSKPQFFHDRLKDLRRKKGND